MGRKGALLVHSCMGVRETMTTYHSDGTNLEKEKGNGRNGKGNSEFHEIQGLKHAHATSVR